MKIIGMVFFGVLGVIGLVLLLSLFSTFMWYCFDDKLAEVTGVPELGTIPWYNVWPATLFLSSIFKSSYTSRKND